MASPIQAKRFSPFDIVPSDCQLISSYATALFPSAALAAIDFALVTPCFAMAATTPEAAA